MKLSRTSSLQMVDKESEDVEEFQLERSELVELRNMNICALTSLFKENFFFNPLHDNVNDFSSFLARYTRSTRAHILRRHKGILKTY